MEFEILDILVCPACKSKLNYKNERLKCSSCNHEYPLEDDIPVLLPKDE